MSAWGVEDSSTVVIRAGEELDAAALWQLAMDLHRAGRRAREVVLDLGAVRTLSLGEADVLLETLAHQQERGRRIDVVPLWAHQALRSVGWLPSEADACHHHHEVLGGERPTPTLALHRTPAAVRPGACG